MKFFVENSVKKAIGYALLPVAYSLHWPYRAYIALSYLEVRRTHPADRKQGEIGLGMDAFGRNLRVGPVTIYNETYSQMYSDNGPYGGHRDPVMHNGYGDR